MLALWPYSRASRSVGSGGERKRKGKRKGNVELHRMMMEEQVEWLEECQLFQRKRNIGARSGGTTTTGRAKYEDSVWGRILRDPQLSVAGSPLRKVFMRRFRVPYSSIFLKLVE